MINFTYSNNLQTTQSYSPQMSIAASRDGIEVDESSDIENSVNSVVEAHKPKNDKHLNQLSEAETEQVKKLKQRDREVRAHEQAHIAAAGSLAKGGPSYEYQTGPDGKRYAVGGSVDIDTSPVEGDPKATLEKAQKIQRAALAPAEPSQQDRAVAAEAAAMAAEARAELASENSTGTIQDESESNHNICADCGGQHSATSHSMSINLENAYVSHNTQKIDSVFKTAA